MASAQVLKKQDHLEAGKKKLEEFRRKRAAKKANSTNVKNEKQHSVAENVRVSDSNGVGTSDVAEIPKIANKEYDIYSKSEFSSSSNKNVNSSLSDRNDDVNASVLVHLYSNNEDYREADASIHLDENPSVRDKFQSRKDEYGASVEIASGINKKNLLDHKASSSEESYASSSFTYDKLDKNLSNDINRPEKDVAPVNSTTSSIFSADVMPKDFASSSGNSRREDNKLTNYTLSSISNEKFSDYNSEARSSLNYGPPSPPASGRRSRPSFLDSIQISKGPSSSPLFGTEKADISSSKVFPEDGLGSSASQRLASSSVEYGDGVGPFNHITEDKHKFFSQNQNEDFAALEQHIEDLTQEKFSLQRALEASRALAESLASENSALTDSYNQQGTIVNQLKSDLERLQEEIKGQLVELNAVRMEYANAQLECDAADERAKLLASEVIALEEKALRLRSNELKLERELENTQAEISSYRKKMSSNEKDRQDLQSTIDALQEEKKLLQSKLWNAATSGKTVDLNKISTAKTDASTSTDDLDNNTTMESANLGSADTVLLGDEVPSSQFSTENVYLEGLPVGFPSDQIRTIQNINTLIVELALEKEQLMQALSTESSQSFKLLELNKELTRKLEAQTQRLELLMAQSMAYDSNQPRHQDIQTVHESVMYADEGDEVVERVLGWIMKLFPGGPSRRRPSKHL